MVKKLFATRRITAAHAFFLGALLALIALCPAILPYGGQYVTRGDYIEQQLPFILETKRILTEGASYSFNTFLGAPAVGSYAFYTLGSVFVWPLALLDNALIPYGVAVMAVLKHAVGTMIAFLYFRRMLREDRLSLLGGVLYMFSSFTVVNTQFYHFTEVIAFFPLILLGLETAMSDRPARGTLALFCALNALTNYYFMLSSALLAAMYFAFRFFSEDWKPQRSLRRVAAVVFECAAGCALSGVLLLPAMRYMLSISRGGFDPAALLSPYTLPALLERVRALLMPIESGVVHAFYGEAASWSSTAAYVPVFGLSGAIVLFAGKRHGWLKALLGAMAMCSVVPALCGAFALFTNVSYTRWWYGLSLMLVLSVLYALQDAPLSSRVWRAAFAACCAAALALVSVSFLPESLTGVSFTGGAYASAHFRGLSIALSLLAFGSLALLVFRPRQSAALALCCAVACAQYAGYIAVGDRLILSGGTQAQNGVYTLDEIAEPTLAALEAESPQAYYRIDYSKKLRNYGLLRGQSATTSFSSLRPGVVNRFAEMAGFGFSQSPTVTPPDKQGAMRALLSVKEYHQLEGEAVPEGFVFSREENGVAVYENEYYVPMGFLQTIYTGTHDQPMQPQDVAPTLLAAAALEPAQISKLADKMTRLDVYNIPDWQESVQRLKENSCDRFETNADGFAAHIDAREAGLLVFTIPYDKGFTASIDGQNAEIIPCDVAFMGVFVEPGEHDVVFTYRTRSLDLGAAMSFCAAAALLAYVLIGRKGKN